MVRNIKGKWLLKNLWRKTEEVNEKTGKLIAYREKEAFGLYAGDEYYLTETDGDFF